MNAQPDQSVRIGQMWEDRGFRVVVKRVDPMGGAVVALEPSGLRIPVQASYFSRARLVSDAPDEPQS